MRKSGWYSYSFVVWILAVLAALSSCLTGMHSVYAVVLLLIMPEWFMLILTANREKLTKYEIVLECPKAIMKISLICILYGVVNFLLGMFMLRNGGPQVYEGVYCLWNHGFIREITEREYKALSRIEGRMFTGSFLIFATVAMCYFATRERIRNLKCNLDKEWEE